MGEYMTWQPNKFKITKGCDYQLLVHLLNEAGEIVNISGATAVKLLLKKADGTCLEKDAYTGLAVGILDTIWVYGFQLSAAETLLLPTGKDQAIDIKVLFGALVKMWEIPKALTVAVL